MKNIPRDTYYSRHYLTSHRSLPDPDYLPQENPQKSQKQTENTFNPQVHQKQRSNPHRHPDSNHKLPNSQPQPNNTRRIQHPPTTNEPHYREVWEKNQNTQKNMVHSQIQKTDQTTTRAIQTENNTPDTRQHPNTQRLQEQSQKDNHQSKGNIHIS